MADSKNITGYRDLNVWDLGMQIAELVYQLTGQLPKEESYGLTSQLRRAAVSISANIAEGHAKGFTKDYLRHLAYAIGSLAEVETLLELSVRLGFLSALSVCELNELIGEERRMLRGLQRSLRSKI
jgi:four helix bundle protein